MGESMMVDRRIQSAIDPVLERLLLNLHRALDVDSFWKATRQLLSDAISSRSIGLALQPNPVEPDIVRSTLPMPRGFFAAEPLRRLIATSPRKKIARISDMFWNRRSLVKSTFYRRYLAPQNCLHGVLLLFWRVQQFMGAITVLRTPSQGDLPPAEMKLLRRLYPHFLTVLQRLRSVEREHLVRMAFEEFLKRLPLPTIVLRWNLRLVYQNHAAREFCTVWEKGPETARLVTARSPIPPEILNGCRQLKQQWIQAKTSGASHSDLKEKNVHHPCSPNLRATIRLRQLNSAGVAWPHFLIDCQDFHDQAASFEGPASSRLQYFIGLTPREQEVARLVSEGRSNKEIADKAGLSLPTVKRHVHAILHKLEITSRSRLIALMR